MLKQVYTAKELINKIELEDFELYIMIAVGSNKLLHDRVNTIYKDNEAMYYKTYKESRFYNHFALRTLSVANRQAIQQYIGIYLFGQSVGENTYLFELMKKGYKKMYNQVRRSKEVDVYALRDSWLEENRKKQFDTTVRSTSQFTALIYFCKKEDKKLSCDSFDINLLKNSFYVNEENEIDFSDHKEKVSVVQWLKKYSAVGVNKKDFALNLNHYIVHIGNVHKEEYSENTSADISDEEINESIISDNFMKGVTKLATFLHYNEIDPIDLQNITCMTYGKVREVLVYAQELKEHYDLDDNAFEELIGIFSMLSSLAEDYKLTKELLLGSAYEDMLLEVSTLKNNYQCKLNVFTNKEEEQKKHMMFLESSIKKMRQEIQILENQANKYTIKIEKLEAELQKVNTENKLLEEKVLQGNVQIDEQPSSEEMIKYIDSRSIAIVGGNIQWQNNLKAILNNCRFIDTEEVGRNLSFLKNVEYLFFNESVNSHAMYNKIKSIMKQNDIQIYYCGESTNIDLSISNIYSNMKSK